VDRSTHDKTVDARRLGHLKKLRHLLPLLEPLRDCGCVRDRAHNRELHFDQYVTLVLLYLFNPLIDSMRVLQEAAAVEKIAQQLGVGRFSLGSFSESVRVFDPERLKAVIAQLAQELRPVHSDARLKQHLDHVLTIADGTVLSAISKVADAFWLRFKDHTPKHAWKLHVQFDLQTLSAVEVELTDAKNSGKSDEKYVLRKKLQSDHCYVTDRWFSQFTLFNEINAIGSSYVCRAKENSDFEVLEERLLTEADLAAGVVRDARVKMGLNSKPQDKPNHSMRLVILEAEPHEKRGGRKGKTAGPGNKGLIVLATNLLDVPAEIIALIYHYRWTIEVFFRFFKQTLGCRHLISQRSEGIEIQVYCAVIACMLINLWTGRKPGKHLINMLAWYFMGVASEKEVQAFLNRPGNTGIKQRAKDELWKKLGVN
jgi:IS4 transposase